MATERGCRTSPEQPPEGHPDAFFRSTLMSAFETRASIGGDTRVVVILAHPVGHVRTPAAMNAYFSAVGRDAVMVPLHVAPDDLGVVVHGLRRMRNLGGIVVTVPHKEAIAPLCDALTDEARDIVGEQSERSETDV